MFSRRTALKRLDNRTLAARTLNRTVRELSEHVGDDPTPPQLLPNSLGEVRRLPRGVRLEAAWRDRQGARGDAAPPLDGTVRPQARPRERASRLRVADAPSTSGKVDYGKLTAKLLKRKALTVRGAARAGLSL
jgi:hypothetical protein